MKYLVHEIRSQKTREMIVRFRAPERVKEMQEDGHFKWKKGFEHIDANTILLFGRRIIFRELIFITVSANDSQFWRDEHREIILDFTKREEISDGKVTGRAIKGIGAENRDAEKAGGNPKGQGRIKKVAQK